MTSKASHDLVLLSCDCKRTWFPVDSLTPSTSQTLHCCFTILSLWASICGIIFPPTFSLHLWALLYFHAFILRFTATIENWVITSWRHCSKVTHPPPLSYSLPRPFPPLPLGRPLIQHTQYYIPQAVGAPSTLHKHSRPPLSAARGASKPWPQLPPGLSTRLGPCQWEFDWWEIAI